ncbi:MAG TPA: hypothetical protein PLC29_06755, partial [Prolixibacteraceae bacterium]|nr:hypothetical protein [Prolixibacteraceae bacterium]HQB67348.1 hypothetical protein [Prolixibacteraceae bacterium]
VESFKFPIAFAAFPKAIVTGDFKSDSFISPADVLVADTGPRVDYVLTNPFRQEEQHDLYQRGRGAEVRRSDLQPAGLLGDHQQQAA